MTTIKVRIDDDGTPICPAHGDRMVADEGGTWSCADAKLVWDYIRRDLARAFDRAVGAWQPLHNAHDWNGDEDD